MSEPEDTDLLAAEYVLGTLDAVERAGVASRIERDADLAGAVQSWHERLAPLAEATPHVVPPAEILDALLVQLFGSSRPATDVTVLAMRRSMRGWRSAAAGFAALAAALAIWIGLGWPASHASDRHLVAVLQRDAGSPAMVLDVDLADRRLTVRPVSANVPGGSQFSALAHRSDIGGSSIPGSDRGVGRGRAFAQIL